MEVDGENPSSTPKKKKEDHHQKSEKKEEKEKEGHLLLGSPTFSDLGNGRFRCVETGHELPAKEKESYSKSKACRLALIDAALVKRKSPLNLFKPHPHSMSKIVCELTGDTINKSEEHIWKHINGKRFLNKLEEKEEEKLVSAEKTEKNAKQPKKKSKVNKDSGKDDQKVDAGGNGSIQKHDMVQGSDGEEPDFWMPPVGERWDFDDGKGRWEACATSDQEDGDSDLDGADAKDDIESRDLAVRTKRMSIAVGPSSFASRKKKIKKGSSNSPIEAEI